MKYFLLIFIFCISVANAQGVLSGKVLDTLHQPIEDAIVSVGIFNNLNNIFFTKTTKNGEFKLVLPDSLAGKIVLSINVNAFGYVKEHKEGIFKTSEVLEFILIQEQNELPPVLVKVHDINIRKKGDTLSYKASDFSNVNDRVIGDVLKKVPGIEVDREGRIMYNGVPINYFYIDGDNILDDKYNIATQTIPNNIIDKIQVIENNQHVRALVGVVESENAAINITLKNKAKINFINSVDLAAGENNAIKLNLSSLLFKSRMKSINVFKLNNTGNDLSEELISHNLSKGVNKTEVNSEILNDSKIEPTEIEKNRWLFNNAKLFSINNMYTLKNGLEFRINAFHLKDMQEQYSESNSIYFNPSGNINISSNHSAKSLLGQNGVTITLNNNSNKGFLNNSFSFETNSSNLNYNIVQNNQPIIETLINKGQVISNKFQNIFVTKKKHIVEINSIISYHRMDQKMNISPDLFKESINNQLSYLNSVQSIFKPSFSLDNSLIFRISKRNYLNSTKIGFSYDFQKLNSGVQIQELSSSITNAPDSFFNHLQFKKNILYAENELKWNYKQSIISFNLPVQTQSIWVHDFSLFPKNNIRQWIIQPSFSLQQKISIESKLIAKYSHGSNIGSIRDIFRGKIIQDYRDIISNQLLLEETRYNTDAFKFGIEYKNSLKILFAYLNFNYNIQKNDFLISSFINSNSSSYIAIPYDNITRIQRLNFGISKFIFSLNSTLAAKFSLQYKTSPFYQNNQLFNITNSNNQQVISLKTKFYDWFFTEIELGRTFGFSKISGNESLQNTSQLKQKLVIDMIFNKGISIKLTCNHINLMQNKNVTSTLLFGDLFIKYTIKKPNMDIELSGTNLTNQDHFQQLILDNNSFNSTLLNIRPRTINLQISFHF